MGFVIVIAPCACCDRLFEFNAHLVPSIEINGTTQPICVRCVDLVNPRRIANGLAPIIPMPGAYDAEEI